jgi:hypothetical protein
MQGGFGVQGVLSRVKFAAGECETRKDQLANSFNPTNLRNYSIITNALDRGGAKLVIYLLPIRSILREVNMRLIRRWELGPHETMSAVKLTSPLSFHNAVTNQSGWRAGLYGNATSVLSVAGDHQDIWGIKIKKYAKPVTGSSGETFIKPFSPLYNSFTLKSYHLSNQI